MCVCSIVCVVFVCVVDCCCLFVFVLFVVDCVCLTWLVFVCFQYVDFFVIVCVFSIVAIRWMVMFAGLC